MAAVLCFFLLRHVAATFALRSHSASARSPGAKVLSSRPPTVMEVRSVEANAALHVEDVAFGVLSCGRYLNTRVRAQQQTWLRQVPNVIVFSDAAADENLGLEVVVQRLDVEPGEMLLNNSGPRRALPAVKGLYKHYPHVKWYFFTDDDTYVYVSNLLREVLEERNSSDPHYVGWGYHTHYTYGVPPGMYTPRTAIGGAGFAISHGLMVKLAPRIPHCRRAYTWNWQGDSRIAQCVDDLGYGVEEGKGLYPENVETELRFYDGHLKGLPPVSFHHVSVDDFPQLHLAQMVYSSDGTWQADFAPFFLEEVAHLEKSINCTFQVMFGRQVNVSGGGLPSALRANALAAFEAGAPGSAHAFRQQYRGERCPDMSGRPLEVLVDIRCGSCDAKAVPQKAVQGQASPGIAVCHGEMLHSCSFRVELALRCPTWEAVPLGTRSHGER